MEPVARHSGRQRRDSRRCFAEFEWRYLIGAPELRRLAESQADAGVETC
jgi:hypothetical protein